MNSVENAQNVGRILGCLYPEVVSQQSWLAYYYEEFYHITSGATLRDVMDTLLDGVRCWSVANPQDADAAVQWNISGFSGYVTGFENYDVTTITSNGLNYLNSIMYDSSDGSGDSGDSNSSDDSNNSDD